VCVIITPTASIGSAHPPIRSVTDTAEKRGLTHPPTHSLTHRLLATAAAAATTPPGGTYGGQVPDFG
jgi:hypothetical protein